MATQDCHTNVVFVDTNLDTHLALIVSYLDTVSDLKKRILSEHPLCFPTIGQIQIHAIKVKRKGYFYHLSDSMFVRSAFNGFNKSWFLSVDASAMGKHGQNQQSFSPGSANHVASLGIANNTFIDSVENQLGLTSKRVSGLNNFQLPLLENKQDEKEEAPFVSPCASENTGKEAVKNLVNGVKCSDNNDFGIPLPGSIPEMLDNCFVNHELPSRHSEYVVDGSSKGIKDDCNECEEGTLNSVPTTKKKRKSKRTKEDIVKDDTSKENNGSVDNPFSCSSKRVTSSNDVQLPQMTNQQGEKEEIPFVSPCVSVLVAKEAVRNLETSVKSTSHNDPGVLLPGSIPMTQDHGRENHELPSSHIDWEVDGSSKGIKDDYDVCEEGISKYDPSAKKKRKSKMRKEDAVQDDTSKENNGSVDNPVNFPSKHVISSNDFQLPELLDKQDEKKETPFVDPCVSEHPAKGAFKNFEEGVITFDNNDPEVPFSGSIPKTHYHGSVIHEHPSSHIECEVDGSSQGIKDDYNACEEAISKSEPSAKKKRKSKRRKEDAVQHVTSKENNASVVAQGEDPIQQDNGGEEVIKESEVLKEHHYTGCKNNNIKIAVDAECNDLTLDASEVGPTTNKKHRKRKRSLTHDSKEEILKEEDATQKDEAQKSNEACKERKELKDQFEFSKEKSNEDASDTRPPAKRKKRGGGRGIGLVDASGSETTIVKSPKAANCDPACENVGTEGNPLNETEGENVQQEKAKGTLLSETEKEDDFNADNDGSLEQTKTKTNAEQVDKKHRKKSKSKQTSTVKSISNMLTEDQLLDSKKPSQIFSEKEDNNLETTSKSDRSKADQQIESQQQQHEAHMSDEMLVDKINGADKRDIQLLTGKNMHMLEATEGQTHAKSLSYLQQLLSKEEGDVLRAPTDIHGTGQDAKLSSRSKTISSMSSAGENRKPRGNATGKSMDLEKQIERIPISNPEGSKKKIQNKEGKASGNNIQGVLSNTLPKKSLLAGAIFKDDSNSTSEDEDEVDNSDASTRSPSDNSLLSEYSDGDSNADLRGGKRLEGEASLSGTKGVSIDRILRSSSRYKRAKLTASQLEETESQPLDFVPDSLADL